ncbi:MAG: serine hydrolase domain-containing protein [Nocardioidaceae bacterium]
MTARVHDGRRLDVRLARAQAAGRLPSVVGALVRDGAVAWWGAAGEASTEPLDRQYRIGSITKTVTAVLVLQLVRDGRLGLDHPASAVLDDPALRGSLLGSTTVRGLLSHHGGLPSEPVGDWWERSDGVTWDELVEANSAAVPRFPARQQFHYSNLSYALLGEIVARLHGRPWWDCARDLVLRPLGMTRTSYLPEAPSAPGLSVHPYLGTLSPEPATDTRAMAPAGQLWSTATDLASYAAFLVDGHPDVLGLDELSLAAHPQSGDRDDALGYAHGLGFMLNAGGSGMVVGHTGSMPGFLASCLVDRERRTGAVLLANATTGMDASGLAVELLELLEELEPTMPTPWVPTVSVPDALLGVPGMWHWGNTAHVFELVDGRLVARLLDGTEKHVFEVREGRVVGVSGYHAGEELHVLRDAHGTVDHLEVATFVLTRSPSGDAR